MAGALFQIAAVVALPMPLVAAAALACNDPARCAAAGDEELDSMQVSMLQRNRLSDLKNAESEEGAALAARREAVLAELNEMEEYMEAAETTGACSVADVAALAKLSSSMTQGFYGMNAKRGAMSYASGGFSSSKCSSKFSTNVRSSADDASTRAQGDRDPPQNTLERNGRKLRHTMKN